MHIQKVEIVPIKPKQGLIGFASLWIDDFLYLGSIGIHKRLDGQGFRITYPTKKNGERQIPIYHPTSPEVSEAIEDAVVRKARQVFKDIL